MKMFRYSRSCKKIPFFLSTLVAGGLIWLVVVYDINSKFCVVHRPRRPHIVLPHGKFDALPPRGKFEVVAPRGEFDVVPPRGKFHMVMNLILLTNKEYNVSLLYDNQRPPTSAELQKRQREVEETLQANLNNEQISAIHVLSSYPTEVAYLRNLAMQNASKMIIHFASKNPTVSVNLDYIQSHLQNKVVILSHMDNVLGEGFDKINITTLRTDRMMYALTRHSKMNERNCTNPSKLHCNPGAEYMGSHDTFIWFVNGTFNEPLLKEMDIPPSANGMENLLIWYFRNDLGFKVTNPCHRLIVYHSHCIPIREKGRKRYNRNGTTGLASFTDSLF